MLLYIFFKRKKNLREEDVHPLKRFGSKFCGRGKNDQSSFYLDRSRVLQDKLQICLSQKEQIRMKLVATNGTFGICQKKKINF